MWFPLTHHSLVLLYPSVQVCLYHSYDTPSLAEYVLSLLLCTNLQLCRLRFFCWEERGLIPMGRGFHEVWLGVGNQLNPHIQSLIQDPQVSDRCTLPPLLPACFCFSREWGGTIYQALREPVSTWNTAWGFGFYFTLSGKVSAARMCVRAVTPRSIKPTVQPEDAT